MKILAMSKPGRLQKYINHPEFFELFDITVIPFDASDEEILAAGADADILIADAISPVSANAIRQMKNLKLIHSEGVAFNGIDIQAAKECGVYVCNSKAMNATAVAEQAVLLMLGLLRGVITGDRAVREGHQIDVKLSHMEKGDLKEISDCKIGFVGFGDIAVATAKLCKAMGAELVYYKRHRLDEATEAELGVMYMELDELLACCDIISLHTPVTKETSHMADAAFFSKMKKGSYLVNTARGELVVSKDLIAAIRSGHIAGAGLDCIEGEPVASDNEMLTCEREVLDRLVLSPHLGGITVSSFARGFEMLYQDVMAVYRGERPERIVNGL